MGLHNVSKPGMPGRLREILRRSTHWQVPAVITIFAIIAAAFGTAGIEILKYDRLAIADGEYWRLLSGHFSHLGPEHLLLNIAGLVLVWLLVGRQYTTPQWTFVTVFSLVIITLGFWYVDPNLIWYVGLSGLLHGLLVAGAIHGIKSQTVESAIMLVAVASKLIYEQFVGPLPGSEATAGGAVITNAHLYGAIGGAMAAAILWRRVEPATSI
jgi:rhomboid family GlyGly-CTERM serine protease